MLNLESFQDPSTQGTVGWRAQQITKTSQCARSDPSPEEGALRERMSLEISSHLGFRL